MLLNVSSERTVYCAGSGSVLIAGAAVVAAAGRDSGAELADTADSGGESVATSPRGSEVVGVGSAAGSFLGLLVHAAIPTKTTIPTKTGSICFRFVRFIKNSFKVNLRRSIAQQSSLVYGIHLLFLSILSALCA